MTNIVENRKVAVIGAGPAGLFAAAQLADQGIHVFLINRDIKPGGLAEYGIYPDKTKLKDGLRSQFDHILGHPLIHYYGNVTIGNHGDIPFRELQEMGFDAVLVAVGAQGTKWLGLPGENLYGVYHAKDLIYHYNQLPPFSMKNFPIGKNIAIIGVGNVMLDIAHYMIYEQQVESITAIARRGPAEIKFSRKELQYVVNNLDLAHYYQEIRRAAPLMQALGQDPQESVQLIQAALNKAEPTLADTKFKIQFLSGTNAILGDENNRVIGLEIEENTLFKVDGVVKSKGTEKKSVLAVDTVIFAIGDTVDPSFGIPVKKNEYIKNPTPSTFDDGISYESYDPEQGEVLDGVFLAGWAREASSGLVGLARRDGVNAANYLISYLDSKPLSASIEPQQLHNLIMAIKPNIITSFELKALSMEENRIAQENGLPYYKFCTNEEMLAAIQSQLIIGD